MDGNGILEFFLNIFTEFSEFGGNKKVIQADAYRPLVSRILWYLSFYVWQGGYSLPDMGPKGDE